MTSPLKHEKAHGAAHVLDIALLELLASRICHDIISPVGAVHNGVEFLEEMGVDAGGDAVALISHSAHNAAARLQAFRLVYGMGGADPSIRTEDVRKAFDALTESDGKIKSDWDPHKLNRDEAPDGFCKMLMGCLMLAQESLPKGGTITMEQPDGHTVLIVASGTDAGSRALVREALARDLEIAQIDPRLVHPYVLSALAEKYGFAIDIASQDQGRITFRLSF